VSQGSAVPGDCTISVNPPAAKEIAQWLESGGRLVVYDFCISFILITFRRTSAPVYLRSGDRGIVRGLPYSLLSLLFGWWGLPWGVIYTPLTIVTNLRGGFDVSARLRAEEMGIIGKP
jgi:hypothetical protein